MPGGKQQKEGEVQQIVNLIKAGELGSYEPEDGQDFCTIMYKDTRQVMGIWYTKVTRKGKQCEQWYLRSLTGPGLTKPEYRREEACWVVANFTLKYLRLVKKRWRDSICGFVPVSPEAPRDDGYPEFMDDTFPAVHYQQGKERVCMIYGMCSTLHRLGLCEAAQALCLESPNLMEKPDQCRLIMEFMRKQVPQLSASRLSQDYDILNPVNMSLAVKLVCLMASDGGINHSVCICGGYVFDSTRPFALPLSRQTLNLCCADSPFQKLHEGYMFQEDKYQNNKIIETGLLQMVPTDLEPLVQPSEDFDQIPKLCFLQESTDEPCLVLGLVNALYHLRLPVVGGALLEERDALLGSGHPSLVKVLYT